MKGCRGTLHAVVVSKKKKRGVKNYIYIYKVFQTIHPTLVIKSVPPFWHKGVGKANHVIEPKKKEEKRNDMTRVRAQVVAKAPGSIRVMVLVI